MPFKMVTEAKACWQSVYTKGSVSSAPLTVHVCIGGAFGHVCVQRSRRLLDILNYVLSDSTGTVTTPRDTVTALEACHCG